MKEERDPVDTELKHWGRQKKKDGHQAVGVNKSQPAYRRVETIGKRLSLVTQGEGFPK